MTPATWRLATLLLLTAACASAVPDATAPLDWSAVGGERVPVLVTRDPDDGLRETKLWLVVVDGRGFLRTTDTRWFANLERDPGAMLRVAGAAYPVRATLETNQDVRERVIVAFRAKYGWQDRLLAGGSSGANILRLDAAETRAP